MSEGRGPATPGPSTLRVVWLIALLSARRRFHRLAALRARPLQPGQRGAVGRKPKSGRLLLAFFGLVFGVQTLQLSAGIVRRIARAAERADYPSEVIIDESDWLMLEATSGNRNEGALDDVIQHQTQGIAAGPQRQEHEHRLRKLFEDQGVAGFRPSLVPEQASWPAHDLWYSGSDRLGMFRPLALVAFVLGLAQVLLLVASADEDLARVGAGLEWLFSFPVPARSLFLARALSVVFTGPLWVLVFPFYAVAFWCAGYGPLAILLAVAATLYLALIGGGLRVGLEATLRRTLSLSAVSRVQAILIVSSFLAMLATFTFGFSPRAEALFEWGSRLPAFAFYTPLALPMSLVLGGWPAVAAGFAALAFAAGWLTSGVWIAEHMVQGGITSATSPHAGRRGLVSAAPARARVLFRGVVLKEIRVLLRDRRLRAQAFVAPFVLFGVQLWLNPDVLPSIASNPRHIATAAFACAALALTTGASNALATEGPALWLLYTAPKRLERLLLEKLWVWLGVAYLFAFVVFGVVWLESPSTILATLPHAAVALVGIYIYGVIALGIGALGTDALEVEPRRRMRAGAMYLFMLLASLFAYALYTASPWAKFVQLVLSALLGFALWQKLRDHLPFMLDPSAAPAPEIGVADGVIAALAFFVLQGVFVLIFESFGGLAGYSLLIAFVSAGVLVALLAFLSFRRLGVPRLLRALGLERRRENGQRRLVELGLGIGAGVAAAVIAMGYLSLAEHVGWLQQMLDETPSIVPEELGGDTSLWFAALAVLAAPVFEEFIFRGILYRGLRRSLRAPLAALASALVFALVHPPVAALPVFAMALFASAAYERTGWLATPIAAHMTYNALVVGSAFW